MEMSFYTAKAGAAAQQSKLDVVANNLANVNTVGYKAKSLSFSDLIYSNMAGIDGDDTNAKRGSGSKPEKTNASFDKAGIMTTGEQLDFYIEGSGFFCLENPANGERMYTTNGSFVLSQRGEEMYVASKDGYLVIGKDDNPIRVINTNTSWTDLGTDKEGNVIEDMSGGVKIEDVAPAVFDFQRKDGMLSVGNTNFIPVEKSGPAEQIDAMVIRGGVEISNVDIGLEYVKAIEAQRAYQYSIRMVQTTDEIQNLINNLRS